MIKLYAVLCEILVDAETEEQAASKARDLDNSDYNILVMSAHEDESFKNLKELRENK